MSRRHAARGRGAGQVLAVAWCVLLAGVLVGQAATVWLAAQGWDAQGVAGPAGFERMSQWLSPVWLLACLGLLALHRVRGCSPSCEHAFTHWALPGLALWSAAELVRSSGWSRVSADVFADQPGAPAHFLAVARLDHPWPIAGALLAAVLFGVGAARMRGHGTRPVLLVLLVWACLRALVDGLEWWLARAIVAGGAALSDWSAVDRLLGLALVVALLTLAFAPVAFLARGGAGTPGQRLPVLCAGAVALLCMFDASRVPAVDLVARGRALEGAVARTGVQVPTASGVAGAVPRRVALLHADLRVSLVDRAGMRTLPAGSALPLGGRGLTILADGQCRVGDLVQLVAPVPADYPLRLGARRVLAGEGAASLPGSAFASIAVSRSTIDWVGFATDRSALLAPDAPPPVDLTEYAPDALMATLPLERPLLAPRMPATHTPATHTPARRDSLVGDGSLWRALGVLYVTGI